MSKPLMRPTFAILLVMGVMLLPSWVHACSVCMGDADNQVVLSVGMAMMMLLGVTGTMLGSIAAFMVHLSRRARKFNQKQLDESSKPGV